MPNSVALSSKLGAAAILDAVARLFAVVSQAETAAVRRDALAVELAQAFGCTSIVFRGSVPEPEHCFMPATISAATVCNGGKPKLVEHPLADRTVMMLASTTAEDAINGGGVLHSPERRWSRSRLEADLVSHVFPPGADPMELMGIVLHQPATFDKSIAPIAGAAMRLIEHGSAGWWTEAPSRPLPSSQLSPRLRAVLDCLLEGRSEKEVAGQLRIAPGTVHTYVVQLYRLHRVNSRGELLAKFINHRANGASVHL